MPPHLSPPTTLRACLVGAAVICLAVLYGHVHAHIEGCTRASVERLFAATVLCLVGLPLARGVQPASAPYKQPAQP